MAIERVKCYNCYSDCCIITKITTVYKNICEDPQGGIIVGGIRYKPCNPVKLKFSSCVPSYICNLPPKCWGNRWHLCATDKRPWTCNSQGICWKKAKVDWPKTK